MASWQDRLKGDPLPWLLEKEASQPAIRYFALRDILGRPESDKEVWQARAAIMDSGPVPAILASQAPEGYWFKPGAGYSPKYRSTVWQVIFLAQLGADGADPRVRQGCEYLLSHTIAGPGGFTCDGLPSGFIHCLAGNLGAALIDLGWLADPRLRQALDWQARLITGDGVADSKDRNAEKRYYYSTPGPLFVCNYNAVLPCGWGAVKAMLALGKIPASARTPVIKKAIRQGADFLLNYNIAAADYPFGRGKQPSSSWFKFGYPLGYTADILQNLEALVALGQAGNPKLSPAIELVLSKQDPQGRWKMEYSLNSKFWTDVEQKGQPSKWITLRALRVLKKSL